MCKLARFKCMRVFDHFSVWVVQSPGRGTTSCATANKLHTYTSGIHYRTSAWTHTACIHTKTHSPIPDSPRDMDASIPTHIATLPRLIIMQIVHSERAVNPSKRARSPRAFRLLHTNLSQLLKLKSRP